MLRMIGAEVLSVERAGTDGVGGANSLFGMICAEVLSVERAGTDADAGTSGIEEAATSGTAGISAAGMSPTSAMMAVFEKAVGRVMETNASTDERAASIEAKEKSKLWFVIPKDDVLID